MNAVVVNRFLGVLAWAGVVVAGLLTYSHLSGASLICGASDGCDAVAAHPSSKWFGIPVAAFGLAAYLALAGLALVRATLPHVAGLATKAGFALSAIGVFASLVLTYMSLSVIRATCPWCLASTCIMVATMILHAMLASREPMTPASWRPDMAIAAIGLVLAIGAVGIQASAPTTMRARIVVTAHDLAPKAAYWKGDADARVQVVEYSDIFCPACRQGFPVVQAIFSEAEGRIRWAFRGYPIYQLEGHQMSLPATMASELAAEDGKFWAFLNLAFTEDVENMRTVEEVADLLGRVGGDRDTLIQRVAAADENDPLLAIIDDDKRRAESLGVTGTPMYVVFAEGQTPMIAPGVAALQRLLNQPEYKSLWSPGG